MRRALGDATRITFVINTQYAGHTTLAVSSNVFDLPLGFVSIAVSSFMALLDVCFWSDLLRDRVYLLGRWEWFFCGHQSPNGMQIQVSCWWSYESICKNQTSKLFDLLDSSRLQVLQSPEHIAVSVCPDSKAHLKYIIFNARIGGRYTWRVISDPTESLENMGVSGFGGWQKVSQVVICRGLTTRYNVDNWRRWFSSSLYQCCRRRSAATAIAAVSSTKL